MKYKVIITILGFAATCIISSSCQKELSCEGPECRGIYDEGKAVYSFFQANGNCTNAIVKSSYFKAVALNDSNYVSVEVYVSKKGAYTISTDTVNGFYFSAKGIFTDTIVQLVVLKGNGKPLNVGSSAFIINNPSGCSFSITVDTLPIVEKYYYDVTIDGRRYQQTVGGNGIIMRNRNSGIEQITAINSYIGTDGPLAVNDSSANNDGLFISKAFIQSTNITLNGLASFFSPSPQVLAPFSNSGYRDGIRIAWTNVDAEPVFDAWKSTNFPGTQTGSSFIITSVETYADAQGKPIAKVKASFNCILYNERGESKVLINGRFYGEFAGFDRIKYN